MNTEELLIDAKREIADQRAVMAAQAKIISLLWARQRAAMHLDDVVAFASGADKMIFSSD
jgi:hypothetical protein